MNIAEILKNAPKGTKLYSPLFGEVKLQSVSDAMIEVFPLTNSTLMTHTATYLMHYSNESTKKKRK